MALVRSEMQLMPIERREPPSPHAAMGENISAYDLPFSTSIVGGYLLWRLYQLGIDHIFGVPGDYAMGMFELISKSPIKYIGTCNELNAGYAADGYARIRGIGALAVTYGVGELSALNAVAGALSERIPLVVIVGVPPTSAFEGHKLLHHTMGSYNIPSEIFAKVTCAQALLMDVLSAPDHIDCVLAQCVMHQKPVYIAVPSDIVFQPCTPLKGPFPYKMRPQSSRMSLLEAVDEAAVMLNHAKHPIIIADVMVLRCKLQQELLFLIESSGIPFATMMMGKTVINERHPQFIGLYAGSHSRDRVRERVEKSDCILLIGAVLSDFNTGGFTTNLESSRVISIGDDHVSIKHHSYHNIWMGDMIRALTSRLLHRNVADDIYMTPASIACRHRPDLWDVESPSMNAPNVPLKAKRFFDFVSKILPDNCIVLADLGECLFSLAETLMPSGATFIAQSFYGSIGYTVGATLGVCAALENSPPRPVFLFVGDGSLQMTCQELSTIIRQGYTPFVFVLNNSGYSIERCILDGEFNSIAQWKYHLLPVVFGGSAGSDVNTEDDLQRAVRTAFESWLGQLHLIEVHVPSGDVSESMKAAGQSMAEAIRVAKLSSTSTTSGIHGMPAMSSLASASTYHH